MKRTTLIALGLVVAAGCSHAAELDLGKLPAPATQKGVTYGQGGPGGGGLPPPAKPLTPEQVALVRSWMDQSAK